MENDSAVFSGIFQIKIDSKLKNGFHKEKNIKLMLYSFRFNMSIINNTIHFYVKKSQCVSQQVISKPSTLLK